MRRSAVLEKGRVGVLAHAPGAMQIGDHDAGVDGIDANPLRRQLQRRAPRQVIEPCLADTIGQYVGERSQARHRRDIHNRSPRSLQMGNRQMHEVEDRTKIDRHHFVPELERCRLNRSAFEDAGGVDEDIESSHQLDGARDDSFAVSLEGQVRHQQMGARLGQSVTNVLEGLSSSSNESDRRS